MSEVARRELEKVRNQMWVDQVENMTLEEWRKFNLEVWRDLSDQALEAEKRLYIRALLEI